LAKYPEFRTRDFYLTGESYAGKYLPLFTHDILEDNKVANESQKIQLVATMIGDPYPSPVIQRTHMHLVPAALGILDDLNLEQIQLLEQRCQDWQSINMTTATDKCNNIMDYIELVSGNVMEYNSQIFAYDWTPHEESMTALLTTSSQVSKLYEAIHISDSTKTPKF